MSEHEEYTTNGGGACSTCDQEWPCRDALAERVRELEAALIEIRDSITGALLPSAGLTHNAAPNSIPIQTYLISADGVKTLGAALAASRQPEAGAAVEA